MALTDINKATVAAADKNLVAVELYDLSISAHKEDRFGRVVTGKSLNENDLIKIAVQRRTDISPATFRAVLDILKDIAGSKIRVEGDKPEVGIKFINQADSSEVKIPATAILVNNPSAVTIVIPADLPKGDYKLAISTQYSSSGTQLKEVRTFMFDYVLTA